MIREKLKQEQDFETMKYKLALKLATIHRMQPRLLQEKAKGKGGSQSITINQSMTKGPLRELSLKFKGNWDYVINIDVLLQGPRQ